MIHAIQKATMRVLHRDAFGDPRPLEIKPAFARTVIIEGNQGYDASELISAICALLGGRVTARCQSAIRVELQALPKTQASAVFESLDTPEHLAHWAEVNGVSVTAHMRSVLLKCRDQLVCESDRLCEIYQMGLAELLNEYTYFHVYNV